jgi:hypothetical protein
MSKLQADIEDVVAAPVPLTPREQPEGCTTAWGIMWRASLRIIGLGGGGAASPEGRYERVTSTL